MKSRSNNQNTNGPQSHSLHLNVMQGQQVKTEGSQLTLGLNERQPGIRRTPSRPKYELWRESGQTSRLKRVSSSIIPFFSKGRVAIATHHRLSGLNNINLFSHSSRNWKFKVRVPAGLTSSEASCSGLQIIIFPTSLVWSVLQHTAILGVFACPNLLL